MLPEHASKRDKAEWLPTSDVAGVESTKSPADLEKRWNPETAVYILANVGDEFCELKKEVRATCQQSLDKQISRPASDL